MPGCVLRVIGENFDVDAFLAQSSLQPDRVHRRGESRRRAGVFSDSGLAFDISDDDGQLSAEISDAIQFLTRHEVELRHLKAFPGVTDLRLDFGYYARDVVAQFDYLPPELLARAGNLGIGIELSLYPASSESIAAESSPPANATDN